MSATIKINRITGPGAGSGVDITNLKTRSNTIDTHSTNDTTSPIQVPSSGVSFSYWVTTRLNAIITPAGTINNLKWYTDGANNFGTGVTCKCAKASTGANAGYRQAIGTIGTTGTQLTTSDHTGLDELPANAFGFTSGSPKSLSGSISNPDTGLFGDHLVHQIEVDSTAGPGATTSESFVWKFDET